MLKSLSNFFFTSIDSASLGWFRIVFGLLGFLDILNSFIYYHLQLNAYSPAAFRFGYLGFDWINVLPEPWMTVFFLFAMVAAILVMLGLRYRIATTIFAFCFTYLFLLEKAHYLNHGYLFCWLSWVMTFLPAHASYSMDGRRKPAINRRFIPYWPLFALQFMMSVVYFFGGLAKINSDWLSGVPLNLWLQGKTEVPLIGPLLRYDFAYWFMSYGGLILDLTIVLFLVIPRTRRQAFLAAIFFHTVNALIFNIGIFPYLSLALTALFFPPSFPRQLFRQLRLERDRDSRNATALQPMKHNYPVTAALLLLMLIHIALPLRHHFFPGQVAWNEFGHRYAWRMMLRTKHGSGTFTVIDRESGSKEELAPEDILSERQANKMFTHPDMIWQFAQHLKRDYHLRGKTVEIYADIKVSLNGKKPSRFVDPSRNLAITRWKFLDPPDWILDAPE